MRRSFSVRSRRSLATFVALAAVAGAAPVLASAPAVAADLAPWSQAWKVNGTNATTSPLDLISTPDGSAVALWHWRLPGTTEWKLYAARRPAGANWTAPRLLATTPTEAGWESARLTVAGNRAVAMWMEFPDDTGPGNEALTAGRIMTATQNIDGDTWSAPQPLVDEEAGSHPADLDLAAAPNGAVTAVWTARPLGAGHREAWAATRSAAGTWSAPVQISTTAADGDTGVDGPRVTVKADGTAVVAYRQSNTDPETGGGSSIRTSVRAADATSWSKPVPAATSSRSLGFPRLSTSSGQLAAGQVSLTWTSSDPETGDSTIHTALSADPATGWTEAKPFAVGGNTGTPETVLEPDGDLTAVWVGYQDGDSFATRTTTLDHGTGAWSPVKKLSTQYVPEQFDVATGTDGTVRVLWTQEQADGTGRELFQAALTGDTWSASSAIKGSQADWARGQVTVDGKGDAVAIWSGETGSTEYLWYAYTTVYVPPLKVVSSTVPATIPLAGTITGSKPWAAVWTVNHSSSNYTLTVTDLRGNLLKELKGVTSTDRIAPGWNGRTTSGSVAPNGPVKWTLKGIAGGQTTEVTLASGNATITGGGAVYRDFGSASGTPDGFGDAVVTTANGGIRSIFGDRATGAFKGSATGYGWPAGIRVVPVKDMSGDRCNDFLVRNAKGELRRYTPACGKLPTPTTTSRLIGGGWNQYDVLTSTTDVTGDGRPDLVARNASTGHLYLYARTGDGILAPRVQLPGAYKQYKKVVGAGDLNGDGKGDLLLQDANNNAYRMYGQGNGTFSNPDYIGAKWGVSYNSVVSAGDFNGDGKDDLLARDTSGNIWRHHGTANGALGAGVKIATGWQVYGGLV
ncbi:FG-GAP-like repeat-containing protein [Streptomyces sp. NPDC101132]|uniref:FG-GAP-like repeat-containing protein n=1 Tax=Streptomyces sp. NPDC101132 TaxID=3366110 RepID=UPI0037FAB883